MKRSAWPRYFVRALRSSKHTWQVISTGGLAKLGATDLHIGRVRARAQNRDALVRSAWRELARPLRAAHGEVRFRPAHCKMVVLQ